MRLLPCGTQPVTGQPVCDGPKMRCHLCPIPQDVVPPQTDRTHPLAYRHVLDSPGTTAALSRASWVHLGRTWVAAIRIRCPPIRQPIRRCIRRCLGQRKSSDRCRPASAPNYQTQTHAWPLLGHYKATRWHQLFAPLPFTWLSRSESPVIHPHIVFL